MSGTEQLGRLFRFDLELASELHQIAAEDIVGKNVTIRLNLSGDEPRYFNGFVSRFTQTLPVGGLARYRATMVPWLWFLTRTADCRIFQKKSVPDIIEEVFGVCGFTDFERSLSTDEYRTWEYCVQYRETDFNFVSRLMEQEGIYYFFRHKNGEHLLVLADSVGAHKLYSELKEADSDGVHQPYLGYDQIRYHPADAGVSDEECISDWTVETCFQPGSYALNDFDFKKPNTPLQARTMAEGKHANPKFEIYDYPGEYTEVKPDGEDYTRKRIQELHAQCEVATANSDVRGICVGCKFTLTDHPREDQNRDYLITSANYNIDSGEFYSGGEGGGACVYSCSFTAIDVEQPFRSPRITPKPSIPGPQTAMVVGKSGEEILTDKYGRVKVQFHWDRQGTVDENSSCWIRVAQVWAGKNWGAMYIPRIGQEVIVEFLEGDPDRPIITGRVYNALALPPYDPKTNPTTSTIKSSSSKGGQGFNEIRFEDKKGEEQVFIHAEKDLHIRVKNDRRETIVHDRHLIVENDKFEHVKNERNETVDKSHFEEIGEDRNLAVKGKEDKEVQKDLCLTVKGNVEETFEKDHTEETTKNYTLKAKEVTIEGESKIELKVGGSTIKMDSGQIEIKGTMVKIN